MGITLGHVAVRDDQYGPAESIQRLEHGCKTRFVHRLQYLVENE